MTGKLQKAFVVYCSPAGTTRHVSQTISRALQAQKIEVIECNLSKKFSETAMITKINRIKNHACLFIGSPVYASHAIPPVMDFIARLPEKINMPAVPFVTYGGVTSGIALYEMAQALTAKKMKIIGAAKIMAQHALLWQTEDPLGKDRPDESDDNLLREMVSSLLNKLSAGTDPAIDLSTLSYYSPRIVEKLKKTSLKKAKSQMPKRKVDEDACNECRECSAVCPTDAITFTPYPEFEANCIFCYNCVRLCPEDAIKADFTKIEKRIRDRAEEFKETPESQIFL